MYTILLRTEVVLIGPIGTGKSTVGKLLAKQLNLPQCSMDKHRWPYYQEIGYDDERAGKIGKKEGFPGVYKYWKEFEIHAVERLLQELKIVSLTSEPVIRCTRKRNIYLEQ